MLLAQRTSAQFRKVRIFLFLQLEQIETMQIRIRDLVQQNHAQEIQLKGLNRRLEASRSQNRKSLNLAIFDDLDLPHVNKDQIKLLRYQLIEAKADLEKLRKEKLVQKKFLKNYEDYQKSMQNLENENRRLKLELRTAKLTSGAPTFQQIDAKNNETLFLEQINELKGRLRGVENLRETNFILARQVVELEAELAEALKGTSNQKSEILVEEQNNTDLNNSDEIGLVDQNLVKMKKISSRIHLGARSDNSKERMSGPVFRGEWGSPRIIGDKDQRIGESDESYSYKK